MYASSHSTRSHQLARNKQSTEAIQTTSTIMFHHFSNQFDTIRSETDGEPKHHKAFRNFHFQFSHFPTDIIYNHHCPASRPVLFNMDSLVDDDDDDA